MGFTVRDMVKLDVFKTARSLGNESGWNKEVKGVSIIESPDILKFIQGG